MKKNKNDTNNIISGLFWTFGERIFAQLVTTIVTIILARLLEPEYYGIISIVTVFISLCNVFVSSGFGSAVVQKENATTTTFNTAFLISINISLILYVIIFFASPLIAKFYEMDQLVLVTRVMALRIPLAALNNIQHAYIQRSMEFKKFFIATSIGTLISAFIGISCALAKMGVLALVFQYLSNTIIDTIVLNFVGGWKPKIEFSKIEAKQIFSFGWKVLLTELVYTLENDIRSLIVGKTFGASKLAYYDQGQKYPALIVNNVNQAINKVMLPVYSRKQNNISELKNILRNSIRIGMFVLSPILLGFALIANNFVLVVLTDKWLFCVPFIQIFCIYYLTRPLETSCHQALLAIGKSNVVLYIMIAINIFALLLDMISIFLLKSVLFLALGSLLTVIVSLTGFMSMTSKYIGYKLKEQLEDILPNIFICLLMSMFVLSINLVNLPPLLSMCIKIIVGGATYFIFIRLFNIKAYQFLKLKLKNNRLMKNIK